MAADRARAVIAGELASARGAGGRALPDGGSQPMGGRRPRWPRATRPIPVFAPITESPPVPAVVGQNPPFCTPADPLAGVAKTLLAPGCHCTTGARGPLSMRLMHFHSMEAFPGRGPIVFVQTG